MHLFSLPSLHSSEFLLYFSWDSLSCRICRPCSNWSSCWKIRVLGFLLVMWTGDVRTVSPSNCIMWTADSTTCNDYKSTSHKTLNWTHNSCLTRRVWQTILILLHSLEYSIFHQDEYSNCNHPLPFPIKIAIPFRCSALHRCGIIQLSYHIVQYTQNCIVKFSALLQLNKHYYTSTW